jgi:hypothetical protein
VRIRRRCLISSPHVPAALRYVSGPAQVLLLLFSYSHRTFSDSIFLNHLVLRYILENIEKAQSLFQPLAMANFRLSFTQLLFSIAYFCASSICTPVDSSSGPNADDDISSLLQRRDGIFSVLGVAGLGDSTVYPRLEIRDLKKNHPDQWNLFLLGLQRFQAINQDDKLSYFQIAGKLLWSTLSPGPTRGMRLRPTDRIDSGIMAYSPSNE